MDIRKLVGWNLRDLRVRAGLPQDVLAADAEMDRAHVSRIERGIENPTVVILDRLARVLRIPVTRFFRSPRPAARPPKPLKRGPKSKT